MQLYCLSRLCSFSRRTMHAAVKQAIDRKDISSLQSILRSGYDFCPTDVERAARTGDPRLVRWFRDHSVTESFMPAVLRHNSNAIPWSVDCASRGAMYAPTPEAARRLLTDLQKPVPSQAHAPALNVAKDADAAFCWNLVRCQPRGQPSILVLPSRL